MSFQSASTEITSSSGPRILLVGINSRFNHVNLAIRSISQYVRDHAPGADIRYREWTISQPVLAILREIAEEQPAVIIFSVYIWNTELVQTLIPEIPKILPDCIIGAGGPEVSWQAAFTFRILPELDFITAGEGEETTCDLYLATVAVYAQQLQQASRSSFRTAFCSAAKSIPGMYTRIPVSSVCTQDEQEHEPYHYGGDRPLIMDLACLPFPYRTPEGNLAEDIDPEHSIIYYESSRGCPFRCSYCLSSLDKTVRFMPLERIFRDLQFFMDTGCQLVKFVDRTFNLDENRYLSIWRYIIENHNGITTFHFEIAAQFISDQALELLARTPPGAIQFEAGIQTINQKTLQEVGRSADINRIASVIRRIPRTIHTHLDLIAGLPHENLTSFAVSFDYALALEPDMLQLGFLKILSGTAMEQYAQDHEVARLASPPYEVLHTPDLSFADISVLKDVEILLDNFYNSGNFSATFHWVCQLAQNPSGLSLFTFFLALRTFFRQQNLFDSPHKPVDWYGFFHTFSKTPETEALLSSSIEDRLSCITIVQELLRFDYIASGKRGFFPSWYERRYNKDAHHAQLFRTGLTSTRLAYASSDYEEFSINPYTFVSEPTHIFFCYGQRGIAAGRTNAVVLNQ